MPPEIINTVNRHRAAMLAADEATRAAMARQWLQVERDLTPRLDALTLELANMTEPVPLWRLAQLERYQQLQAQINQEMTRYVGYANTQISGTQAELAAMAIEHGAEAMSVVAQGAGLRASFPFHGMLW